MVAKSFEDRTLREMRDMIYGASEELPWLMIDKRSRERIESELLKPYDRDRLMGDIKYREFFMKKGSAESVSDWVSRMNAVIKRESGM